MSRAILATKNGLKSHFPNPMVGCVIVHQNKVIAQGITRHSGRRHCPTWSGRTGQP